MAVGGSLHAGFVFTTGTGRALVVGFHVRLTAQSLGSALLGSTGTWSTTTVAQCRRTCKGVLTVVLHCGYENPQLAWLQQRNPPPCSMELAAPECIGGMLTRVAIMPPWCSTQVQQQFSAGLPQKYLHVCIMEKS